MSRCGARFGRWLAMPALAAVAVASVPLAAQAADSDGLPEIRTGSMNRVPACVTPDRLMAFIAARNTKLPPKFANIAWAYRELGDSARIRWDYAFFQMILETNYLMYRRGDGSSGDVGQAQNNFAGIGATGGGVPGDKYGDVRTGVLAHMQHLLAYSGEKVERPVATRTRDYQNDIIEISRKLKRQVTFGDLSRRWAVDRAYGRNIETVATLYRRMYCTTTAAVAVPQASGPSALPWSVPQPVRANPRATFAPPSRLGGSPRVSEGREVAAPAATALVSTIWQRGEPETPETPPQTHVAPAVTAVPPVPSAPTAAVVMNDPAIIAVAPQKAERLGAARFALAAEAGVAAGGLALPPNCRVYSASYGGSESVLIRSRHGNETRLTAVVVSADERRSMADNFIASHAPGGEIIGHYESKEAAVSAARGICRAS